MVMLEHAALDRRGPLRGPSVRELHASYRDGSSSPVQHVEAVLRAIGLRGDDGTWISVDADAARRRAEELEATPEASGLPLFGVPFGVKDSIDVAGSPTTLACPAYAYTPTTTAPAVQRLLDAGAVFVGKTNLDQFATGLNGTRTPYPVPRSVYGGDLVSGGSSSGSTLAVALGQVPFAVATDTAGSGRVPPALNGVLGLKPSRGLISTVGLVPACRSLDCLSIVAADLADLDLVLDVMAGVDEADPWSRPRRRRDVDLDGVRVGLPDEAELTFFGDVAMAEQHASARGVVADAFRTTTMPLQPFLDAGALLYSGPWVAERLVEFGDFLASHPGDVLPVVETIISGGSAFSATDVFRAQYRLAELKAQVARLFERADVLVVPTVGTTFTVAEVLADPVATNTVLGHYTHFGNLLDLCAVALPAGLTSDGRPASLMLLAPALDDDVVLGVAERLLDLLPAHL